MTLDELELVCQEAARSFAARQGRPLPAAVVLPLPEATRVVTMEGFPDDDPTRFDVLSAFAADTMRPANAPCYGFLAEAVAESEGQGVDVILVAYGARRHRARITAAPLQAGADGTVQVGDFTASEDLDPTALPFLSPLQHAVDEAKPPEEPSGGLPIIGGN